MHKPMKNSRQPEQLFVTDNTHLEIMYCEFSKTLLSETTMMTW